MARTERRPEGRAEMRSPLYTPPNVRNLKLSRSNEMGRDSDGANRVNNRRDGKDKEPAK